MSMYTCVCTHAPSDPRVCGFICPADGQRRRGTVVHRYSVARLQRVDVVSKPGAGYHGNHTMRQAGLFKGIPQLLLVLQSARSGTEKKNYEKMESVL